MDRTPQLIGPDLVTLVNLQMRQYGGLRQAIQDTFLPSSGSQSSQYVYRRSDSRREVSLGIQGAITMH